MIKNVFFILFLISNFLYADTVKVDNLKAKEFFYILEKDGYEMIYQLQKKDLIKLFETKIVNVETDTIVNVLNKVLEKNPTINYYIDSKKIIFHNKNNFKNNNENEKIIIKKENINLNHILLSINSNNEVNLFFKSFEKKFNENEDLVLKLDLNYYGTEYHSIVLTKDNLNEVKNILLNQEKVNYNFDFIDEEITGLEDLKEISKRMKNIVSAYENNLYNLVDNLNLLNRTFYPYIYGSIKYFDDTFYYLKNVDIVGNDSYIDKYNKVILLKNVKNFSHNSISCIVEDLKVICENENIKIEY